jgi:phenylalanyl-tRNA synthetase alpha chain
MKMNINEQLLQMKNEIFAQIWEVKTGEELENIRIAYLGKAGRFKLLLKELPKLELEKRREAGILANEIKKTIDDAIREAKIKIAVRGELIEWFDITQPGKYPPLGHLHPITYAIEEITHIFEKIGFTRVRHPEVDWDWYPFESLNMPEDHPARDEWETFFVEVKPHPKLGRMVLTPHTSNGQIREMEKGKLPIRMINIAKCYRRQSDVSHEFMFHQFEGLLIDKGINIAHLKGVIDYFAKQFFGLTVSSRIRPFHFQFTEPSFEVDFSCSICNGTGKLTNSESCRLCKEGWLEIGGAGMVHPTVLKNGGIDPNIYTGFAFGWGIERAYMIRRGTNINDLRILYKNDLSFLYQF